MHQWNEVDGLGIVVVTLMLDGPPIDGPASVEGALTWKQQFGLEHVYVMSDPNFSMVEGNSVGTPRATIVDPRTMTVYEAHDGYSGSHPELEALAMANKAASE